MYILSLQYHPDVQYFQMYTIHISKVYENITIDTEDGTMLQGETIEFPIKCFDPDGGKVFDIPEGHICCRSAST